jgi:hypothetical protein
MKKYILLFLSSFILNNLFSQNDLGLSKNDIISKYDKCIITNGSDLLALNCDGLIQFYSFDPVKKLCNFYGFEIPFSQLDKFKSQLLDQGYMFFKNLDAYPIIISLKGGNKNTTSPASIYENKEFVISLLKYDLYGDDSTNKVGVYAEYYKKEMFEEK